MGGRTPLPFGGWEHLGHILGNSFERLGHLTDVTNGTSYRECAFPATDRSHLFVARRIGGLLCAKGVALYLCEGGKGTKPPAIVGFPDFTESRLLERLHVARDNNITRQRLLPPPPTLLPPLYAFHAQDVRARFSDASFKAIRLPRGNCSSASQATLPSTISYVSRIPIVVSDPRVAPLADSPPADSRNQLYARN
jgi:hypothetical protein